MISLTRLCFCTLHCGRIRKGVKIKMCWRAITLILGCPTFILHNTGCNKYKAGFSNQTKARDAFFKRIEDKYC